MFTFAAINDEDSTDEDVRFQAPTKEAQEFHLTEMYEDALTKMHAGQLESARDLLQSILQNPLLLKAQGESSSSASPMLHLRFSALKNLAEALTKLGSDYHGEALQCYLQAVEMDERDVVIWNRLGTLAVSLGRFFIARRAFEQGLCCSPRNWLCMEKLIEVLIAVGDELACFSMANRLLAFSPSHPRALYVNGVIEGRIDCQTIHEHGSWNNLLGIAPRGVDLLEPTHHNLSFPKKRSLENPENEQSLKKQRLQSICVDITEITWATLVSALTNVLQERPTSVTPSLDVQGLSSVGKSNGSSIELANAHIKFPVSSPKSNVKDVTGSAKLGDEVALEAHNQDLADRAVDESKNVAATASSRVLSACESALPDTSVATEAGGDKKRTEESGNNLCKETESYQDLSHERRSSRIERLRTGSTVVHVKGEENDEHGKHSMDLRRLLEPSLIQLASNGEDFNDDAMCCDMIDTVSVQLPSPGEEHLEVQRFLDDSAANSGVFSLGNRLLEKMSSSPSSNMKDYSPLLQLEKLLRQSSKWRRSLGCSLFLAELYVDAASTASSEKVVKQSLEDARYHQYDVLQSVAAQVVLSETPLYGLSLSTDQQNFGQDGNAQVNSATKEEMPERHPIKRTEEEDWSIQVQYYWLNGRIQILSGNQQLGIKHLRTCKRLLEAVEQKDHAVPSVVLHHCLVDNIVTASKVQKKLGGLEVVNLICNVATKAYEEGHFQEVIETLTPVLFPAATQNRDGKQGSGCSVREVERCHELVGLSLVLFACCKVRPQNVIVALRCHERRLELLCHVLDGDWGEGLCLTPGTSGASAHGNVQINRSADRSRLITEEVKSISRCAFRIREMGESGLLVPAAVPPALLQGLQELLLTVMGQNLKSLWQRKSVGSAEASLGDQRDSVCLVDAAVAFCRLTYLHTETKISQQVSLLVTVHNILAEHGLCCAGKDCEGGEGAFLNMAIKHLGALDLRLKMIGSQARVQKAEDAPMDQKDTADNSEDTAAFEHNQVTEPDGSADVASVDERPQALAGEEVNAPAASESSGIHTKERRKLEAAIDYALDQSFFCLYGLNLRGGSEITSPEGIAEHKNTNRGDYQTKDECAGVLQYILPYVKSCSRFRLQKLKKVLRAVWAQFPQPPFDVLSTNPVDLFLDDPTFDEGKLYDMIMSGKTVNEILGTAYGRGVTERKPESQSVSAPAEGVVETNGASLCPVTTTVKHLEDDGAIGAGCVTKQAEENGPATDPYIEVYENLYYLLAQIEDMSASDKWPGFILTKEGEEFIHQNSNLVKYDLIYNPSRFESWHRLAHVYDEDVDLLLNDGSKKVSAASWRRKSSHAKRVQASRRRSRRCFLMSLALASTPEQQVPLSNFGAPGSGGLVIAGISPCEELEALGLYPGLAVEVSQSLQEDLRIQYVQALDGPHKMMSGCWLGDAMEGPDGPLDSVIRSEVHGMLALVYFDTLQNVAPSYDQMQHLPIRDASWLSVCDKSFIQFERALSYRPDWTYVFYLGKLAEKMGRPYGEALAYFAKAVKMNPCAVDTFYRLHASRLKLLCKKQLEDTECLHVLSQYSYLPNTTERVSKYFGLQRTDHIGDAPAQTGQEEELLTDSDTCQRLAMVSEETLGKAWKVLFDDCIAALQLCIDGDLKHFHKARYRIAQGFCHVGRDEDIERAKEEISFCFKSHRSPFIIYMWEIDDSSRKNRRKAVTAAGGKIVLELAMQESSRKFITCVRKYLLLYLSLCERTGDISTLERAHVNLRADKKFSICLEDISHVALGHYIRALATAINFARTKSSSLSTIHSLLDKMFNVFLDHGTSWDAVAQSTMDGRIPATQAPEASFYSYIHDYFSYLENSNNVEGLEAVNERIRKRFKSPKLAGANCLQVCRHAAMSWCRTLCTALSAITPLRPERLQSEMADDQQPRLIVDLQQDASAVAGYVDIQQGGSGYAVWNDDTSYGDSAPLPGSSFLSSMRNIHVTRVTPEDLDRATALLRSAYIFYRESASQSFPININLYIRGSQTSLTGFGHPSNFSASRASQALEPLDISTPRKLLLWAFTLVHGQPCSMSELVRHCEDQAKAKYKKGSPAAAATPSGLTGLQGTSDIVDVPGTNDGTASHQTRDLHGSMLENSINELEKP